MRNVFLVLILVLNIIVLIWLYRINRSNRQEAEEEDVVLDKAQGILSIMTLNDFDLKWLILDHLVLSKISL